MNAEMDISKNQLRSTGGKSVILLIQIRIIFINFDFVEPHYIKINPGVDYRGQLHLRQF